MIAQAWSIHENTGGGSTTACILTLRLFIAAGRLVIAAGRLVIAAGRLVIAAGQSVIATWLLLLQQGND